MAERLQRQRPKCECLDMPPEEAQALRFLPLLVDDLQRAMQRG
jgi:hypothetical protein